MYNINTSVECPSQPPRALSILIFSPPVLSSSTQVDRKVQLYLLSPVHDMLCMVPRALHVYNVYFQIPPTCIATCLYNYLLLVHKYRDGIFPSLLLNRQRTQNYISCNIYSVHGARTHNTTLANDISEVMDSYNNNTVFTKIKISY